MHLLAIEEQAEPVAVGLSLNAAMAAVVTHPADLVDVTSWPQPRLTPPSAGPRALHVPDRRISTRVWRPELLVAALVEDTEDSLTHLVSL